MKKIFFVFVFILTVSVPVMAATVNLGPEDSSVMFRIQHNLGYTIGYFDDFQATLEMADSSPAQVVSVKATVLTASVQTRNTVRDEGLRSAMFFDAAQFPQASFESTQVQGDELMGTLTFKGVSQPLTLKVHTNASSGRLQLRGQFNRNDFGVTYNKNLADKKKSIGDIVELIIDVKV